MMGHCYDAWIKPFFITNHKYINKNVVSFILVWLQYNTHILKLRIKDFANFQAKKALNWFNWAKIKSNVLEEVILSEVINSLDWCIA